MFNSFQCFPDVFNDLFVFDIEALTWTNLSLYSTGSPPSPRYCHGFTSYSNKLYVQGGGSPTGKCRTKWLKIQFWEHVMFHTDLPSQSYSLTT